VIEVRDLSVTFGEFSLREVNLRLEEHRCLAILGPSGAGKTLLLETVMGARRPSMGQVLLDGQDLTRLPPEARGIAYIPQDLALFPHLSVRDNIVFGLRSRSERRAGSPWLEELLRILGIESLIHRRDVTRLSGGERQRVALARALLVRPRVLFLDEPFASLDGFTRHDLIRYLRRLQQELGITMFLVTHDLEEASFLADDVAILLSGRIVQSGGRDDVLGRPRSVAVARFLLVRNVLFVEDLPPVVRAHLRGSAAGAHAIGIRPEDVEVSPDTSDLRDQIPGKVIDRVATQDRMIIQLLLEGGLPIEASLARSRAGDLGERVAVRFPPHTLLSLDDV
jgi:ABC-type sugar transport system ATPase subunit